MWSIEVEQYQGPPENNMCVLVVYNFDKEEDATAFFTNLTTTAAGTWYRSAQMKQS